MFYCETCGEQFEQLFTLLKHERINHECKVFHDLNNDYRCAMCLNYFPELSAYKTHIRSCDQFRKNLNCIFCHQLFQTKNSFVKHSFNCAYNTGFLVKPNSLNSEVIQNS